MEKLCSYYLPRTFHEKNKSQSLRKSECKGNKSPSVGDLDRRLGFLKKDFSTLISNTGN
jgi:hypothetical protein